MLDTLTSEVKKAVHVMGCMLDPGNSVFLLLNCQVEKQHHQGFGFAPQRHVVF